MSSNTGSMLDTYLIAQALGWDWNIWTIIIIDGGLFLIFIVVVLVIGFIGVWYDWW